MAEKIQKTDKEWLDELTNEEYKILREKGTERAFTGKYYDCHEEGIYHCAGCGQPLFDSETKYDSGSGWPSFYESIDEKKVKFKEDRSLVEKRTEVVCSRCEGHLGHIFDDGPQDKTGKRFCINSAALNLETK